MLLFAVALFLLAAAFGIALLATVLEERPMNKTVLYAHGASAGTAILLMLAYLCVYGSNVLLSISLILFLLAALGGLTLYALGRNNKPIPKWLAIVHPIIAIAGLITLVISTLPE